MRAEMAITLRIADSLGVTDCTSPEDGARLLEELHHVLTAADSVDVSFAGIDLVLSGFLRSGVCPLISELGWDEFQRRVRPVETTLVQETIWRNTASRAKAYFAAPEVYQDIDRRLLEADAA